MGTTNLVAIPKDERNADAIAKAEHLLELAKSGEIDSFFAAAFRPNGNWLSIQSRQFDAVTKVGVIEAWKFDLLQAMGGVT